MNGAELPESSVLLVLDNSGLPDKGESLWTMNGEDAC
jgi:hypothetical protein